MQGVEIRISSGITAEMTTDYKLIVEALFLYATWKRY